MCIKKIISLILLFVFLSYMVGEDIVFVLSGEGRRCYLRAPGIKNSSDTEDEIFKNTGQNKNALLPVTIQERFEEFLQKASAGKFKLSDLLPRFPGLTKEKAFEVLRKTKHMLSEYLETTDNYGKSSGMIKKRKAVHRDGDWHRTVHIVVVNKNGEALRTVRGKNVGSSIGKKDLVAGHVAAGGSRETAL